jgi:hypothetical protein
MEARLPSVGLPVTFAGCVSPDCSWVTWPGCLLQAQQTRNKSAVVSDKRRKAGPSTLVRARRLPVSKETGRRFGHEIAPAVDGSQMFRSVLRVGVARVIHCSDRLREGLRSVARLSPTTFPLMSRIIDLTRTATQATFLGQIDRA